MVLIFINLNSRPTCTSMYLMQLMFGYTYTTKTRFKLHSRSLVDNSGPICKFQVFVPNEVSLFGSVSHKVNLDDLKPCQGYGSKSQTLRIRKSHVRALDQPAQRCADASTNVNTSACIADFIEREIGCNPNIQGNLYSQGPLCKTKSQLSQLDNLSNKLFESHDNDIYAMTGCLSSCEKDIYSITPEPMNCDPQGGGPLDFFLMLKINDRSYEERKQYVIYEYDSFIADIGGYMGLLLGCSLMSLFNELDSRLRNIINRTLLGHMIQQWGQKMTSGLRSCSRTIDSGNPQTV